MESIEVYQFVGIRTHWMQTKAGELNGELSARTECSNDWKRFQAVGRLLTIFKLSSLSAFFLTTLANGALQRFAKARTRTFWQRGEKLLNFQNETRKNSQKASCSLVEPLVNLSKRFAKAGQFTFERPSENRLFIKWLVIQFLELISNVNSDYCIMVQMKWFSLNFFFNFLLFNFWRASAFWFDLIRFYHRASAQCPATNGNGSSCWSWEQSALLNDFESFRAISTDFKPVGPAFGINWRTVCLYQQIRTSCVCPARWVNALFDW